MCHRMDSMLNELNCRRPNIAYIWPVQCQLKFHSNVVDFENVVHVQLQPNRRNGVVSTFQNIKLNCINHLNPIPIRTTTKKKKKLNYFGRQLNDEWWIVIVSIRSTCTIIISRIHIQLDDTLLTSSKLMQADVHLLIRNRKKLWTFIYILRRSNGFKQMYGNTK